jgi:predicted ATP-grasp superfamily ATP-dependent carboligase
MKREEKKFDVLLVVRLDLVEASRLPQTLHRAGCRVTLFAPAGLAIGRSRFVDRHVQAPAASQALIGQLQSHLEEHRSEYQWVIIGDESLVHDLTRHKGEAWLDEWFPVDHHSTAVDLITSKFDFLRAASEAGLKVPSFEICHTLTEAEQAAKKFGYPVILNLSKGLAEPGVRVVRSREDLTLQFEEIAVGQTVAVQRFVTGALGTTEILFDHGKPVCWASYYNLQCWPTNLSASCVREVMDNRNVEPLITRIGALTGFHGLCGIDWIHGSITDSLSLIEFNPRPTPVSHTGHLAGVSFSAAIRAMLAGAPSVQHSEREAWEEWAEQVEQTARARKIFMFPQSIYRAVDDLDLLMLMRLCPDLPWGDPLLLAAHLRRVCSHYLPLRFRRWAKDLLGKPAEGVKA